MPEITVRGPVALVGLTTYRERARWGVWDEPADLLPVSYATAIQAAGAVAMLLPPGFPAGADAALDTLDGLLLSGGADVDPARYAAQPEEHLGALRPDRDEWELALTRAALTRDMPVLAVCRGMQVLNVALGGDLVQHLPDVVGHEGHCPTVGSHAHHRVRLDQHGRLGADLGTELDVATYHHQAVRRLGAELRATGWAQDGTVEAVELPGATWVCGVQWHPEVGDGATLFASFVRACVGYRERSMP